MWDVDPEIVVYITTIILALLSAFLGKKWSTAKSKFSEMTRLATELAEALEATSSAIEDDQVTLAEEKEIVKEWKDVIEQGKKLKMPKF